MPGILLRRINHRISESDAAFHAILQAELAILQYKQSSSYFEGLEKAYMTGTPQWGLSYGKWLALG